MPTATVTASIQRYLAGIHILQEKNGFARTSELAHMFGVVHGTISNTVNKLKKDGLVKHQPYRGVTLTQRGDQIASNALKKHKLLTRMFTEILDVPPNLADIVAFDIEYYIPDCVIKKIEHKLKQNQ
jgi:DtxR family transcriptional regulator, manganese transport regulator